MRCVVVLLFALTLLSRASAEPTFRTLRTPITLKALGAVICKATNSYVADWAAVKKALLVGGKAWRLQLTSTITDSSGAQRGLWSEYSDGNARRLQVQAVELGKPGDLAPLLAPGVFSRKGSAATRIEWNCTEAGSTVFYPYEKPAKNIAGDSSMGFGVGWLTVRIDLERAASADEILKVPALMDAAVLQKAVSRRR